MNKSLALSILKVTSDEEIQDAFEQYFFDFKQKLIQSKLASPLLAIYSKKLQTATEIEQVLFGEDTKPEHKAFAKINGSNYRSVFQSIQENLAYSKLLISSANSTLELEFALKNIMYVVTYYEGFMLDNFKHKVVLSDNHPKASDIPDIMELNSQIQSLAEKEDKSNRSSEILNNFEEEFPLVVHEIKRIAGYFVDDRIVRSEE